MPEVIAIIILVAKEPPVAKITLESVLLTRKACAEFIDQTKRQIIMLPGTPTIKSAECKRP